MRSIDLKKSKIKRSLQDVIQEFYKFSTGVISDALGKPSPALVSEIKPVIDEVKIAGPAITVRTHPGDWLTLIKAMDVAKAGDILVVDGRGHKENAIFGEIMARSCAKKGIKGIVIDGAVRDVSGIRRIRFPTFARAVTPCGGTGKFVGEINVPIQCGGIYVKPRDIAFGDDDGVVIVPQERVEEVLTSAKSIIKREEKVREEIDKGISLSEIARARNK